jgi:hypothetical protein
MPDAFYGTWQLKITAKSQRMLRSFNDLARLDAPCAHFHPGVSARRQLNADGLQVRVKAASGLVISV